MITDFAGLRTDVTKGALQDVGVVWLAPHLIEKDGSTAFTILVPADITVKKQKVKIAVDA